MKVAGVIAEYNPFHNGHRYQLEQIRKETGADFIIIAMSGSFVQRGGPAIADKYLRTQMALSEGADLVLELPVRYATASAGDFARGGVALLRAAGVVHSLCFGGEAETLTPLRQIAKLLPLLDPYIQTQASLFSSPDEPSGNLLSPDLPEFYNLQRQFHDRLNAALSTGLSYPKARTAALWELTSSKTSDLSSLISEDIHPELFRLREILEMPNNILAIEYLLALSHAPEIAPVLIPRRGDDHNQTSPCDQRFASATAIRKILLAQKDMDSDLSRFIPENTVLLMRKWLRDFSPLCEDDFSQAFGLRLLDLQRNPVTKEPYRRILRFLPQYRSFSSYSELLKTKNMTLSRIRRELTQLLLFGAKPLSPVFPAIPYLRVLGFRRSAAPLLRAIKKEGDAPLLTKMADAEKCFSSLQNPDGARQIFREDLYASELYRQQMATQSPRYIPNEFERGLVIL